MPKPEDFLLFEESNRITEATRREILDSLVLDGKEFHGRLDLIAFLKRIWDLESMPSTDPRFDSADGDIWQHMVRNNDWEVSYLLYEYLELPTASDEVFIKFLETCVHPVVLPDPVEQTERVEEFNQNLAVDGYSLMVKSYKSSKPVYEVVDTGPESSASAKAPAYEVVLSFAGEDREYVEQVAAYLKSSGVSIFYDRYEEVSLWGKDLAEHLDIVYGGRSRYCVIFISKHYADKLWTTHEKRSALAKALAEKNEYILPARFDDTELEGIRRTVGYIDCRIRKPEELGDLILKKLGRKK